ncbi:MAG TPA: hypothetical protein VJU61_21505, partial [Polyangiaceae bacterium]|nr:hypothetical protein [Polyangiaceae bacterium]
MRKLVSIALLLVLGACAGSFQHSDSSLTFTPVDLPAYESERNIGWAASREDYAAALADTRFVMRQFTYQSDGLTVGAYLYGPRGPGRTLAPVIVFNRGSYLRPNGFAGEMLVMARRYAEAGFIVVAPHYRGSNGWAGKDELGGAELHDLMVLPDVIARIPGADSKRLFLAG